MNYCKNSRAQGTVEYLVIIAVVIIIALVVTSLALNQGDDAQRINTTTNKITNTIGQGGISIVDSTISSSGEAVISLKNISGNKITITKANALDSEGNSTGEGNCEKFLIVGDELTCIITDINNACPCKENQTTTCIFKIDYNTPAGPQSTTTTITNICTTPINYYTINYQASTGGTISGTTNQKIIPGQNGTNVTAIPTENYDFNSWSDGSTNPKRYETNVNENKTITATFISKTPEEPTIEFISDCYNNQLDPIPICNCIDLNKVRLNLSANYALQNDIEMNAQECIEAGFQTGVGFEPIGHQDQEFGGNFDGNSKLIKNLYINQPITFCERHEYDGLFATLTGTISRVGLVDININGDCDKIGGLVGVNGGSIIESFTTGNVTGQRIVGGLVGHNVAYISDSYSRADVSGQHTVGGLVGWQYTFDSETWDSYATGKVTGTLEDSFAIGGLFGYTEEGNTYSSYYDRNTTGILDLDEWEGPDFGTPKTTLQMTYPYNSENTYENWDFDTIWAHDTTGPINNGYPYLRWQIN